MIIVAQHCFYIAFHLLFKLFFRPIIRGADYLPNRPFILASNHTAVIDPFLLCVLPYAVVKRIIPIYFLTTEHYYRKWYLRPFISLLGSFPVAKKAWTLDQFLSSTVRKINSGNVVMFFPEGRIIDTPNVEKAKPGIGYLMSKTEKPVVPLRIEWSDDKFLKRIKLTFGKSLLVHNNKTETHQQTAERVMDAIYSL